MIKQATIGQALTKRNTPLQRSGWGSFDCNSLIIRHLHPPPTRKISQLIVNQLVTSIIFGKILFVNELFFYHKVHKDFSQRTQSLFFVNFVLALCPLWLEKKNN